MTLSADTGTPQERSGARSNVARGSLLGMVGQLWHLVTVFALYAFLARRLGPALFGQWRVVLTVLVWFELFIGTGLVKIVTKYVTEGGPHDRPRLARASYLAQAWVAAAAFTALQLLAGPIAAALHQPSLAPLLRIAALDIPLFGVFMVASAVVLGEERFERQAVSWLIYATAKAALIAVLVAGGLSVRGALVGNALSSLVGFAAVFLPWSRGDARRSQVATLSRVMLVASVPFLALSLSEGLGQSADLWFVSAIVPSATLVGLYASATVLAEIPTFLFLGLNRVLFPAVARAGADGDPGLAGRYATGGVRLALMVNVLIVAMIAATGRQALTLVYSSAYAGAYLPLLLLMIAATGRTVRATCAEVLMAEDRRRDALTVMVGTLAVEVVLLLVLVPRWGLNGAAAGVAAAALIGGAVSVLLLARQVGIRPLATLGRCAVAGAVVGVALAYLTPAGAHLWLFVAYPLAAAAYAGLLMLLREIRPDDMAAVRQAVRR